MEKQHAAHEKMPRIKELYKDNDYSVLKHEDYNDELSKEEMLQHRAALAERQREKKRKK
ncbi:MAG: hypothetical protein LIP77_11370 [Planctomycetes bacterium]|nr:hypothetical protein [Planctomycetota bacterium]